MKDIVSQKVLSKIDIVLLARNFRGLYVLTSVKHFSPHAFQILMSTDKKELPAG